MTTALLEREDTGSKEELWASFETTEHGPGFQRWVATLCVVCAIGLFAVMTLPALVGFVFTANDLGEFHLPLRAFYARCLESGTSFDWCPDLYCGFYLTGEGQVGTYHPVHWVLYRFLKLDVAWNIECLLSYPFLFFGTYLMLRRWLTLRSSALFGALCFTFCGFNLLHFVHVNAVAVVAHVPWLLWAADKLVRASARGERLFLTATIGTLTASQLLLGYPQYLFLSLVAEVLTVTVIFSRREARGHRISSLCWWTVAKAVGILAAAIQVLPTIEALGDSVRLDAGSDFAAWGSLHPLNLVQLIAPYLFESRVVGQNTHELGIYLGAAPLVLAVFAFCGGKGGGRTMVAKRIGLFAVLIGFVLALGSYTPLHRLVESAPVLGSLRFPCRAIVLVQLGVMVLAAVGFAKLLTAGTEIDSKESQFPIRSLLGLATVSVALSIAAPFIWPDYVASLALVWIGPGLILMAIMLTRWAAQGSRLAVSLLVIVTASDLCFYGLSYAVLRTPHSLEQFIAGTPTPPDQPPQRVVLDGATTMDRGVRAGNRLLLAGYTRADGYAGLEPARQLDYRTDAAQRVAGATWAMRKNSTVIGSKEEAGWYEVNVPMPRARLVTKVLESDAPRFAIHTIHLQSTAIVATGESPLAAASDAGGDADAKKSDNVNIVRDEPGLIQVEVNSGSRSLLSLTESFHRGWIVDGNCDSPADNHTTRVNGDFLGCAIDPGPRTVTFRFAPESLVWGRAFAIFGLGLLVSLYGFAGRSFVRRS
jgi:hypothetical protein